MTRKAHLVFFKSERSDSLPADVLWGSFDKRTPKDVCGEANVVKNSPNAITCCLFFNIGEHYLIYTKVYMTVQKVCFLVVGLGFLATESDVFLCGPVRLFTGRRWCWETIFIRSCLKMVLYFRSQDLSLIRAWNLCLLESQTSGRQHFWISWGRRGLVAIRTRLRLVGQREKARRREVDPQLVSREAH